jgi:hypothetical protein
MKSTARFFAMTLFLTFCVGNAWAITATDYDVRSGHPYQTSSGENDGHPEYVLSFEDPDLLAGLTKSYGYCVELNTPFDPNIGFDFATVSLSGDLLKAAWLMDTYSTFTYAGTEITGTTGEDTISALQAAIWHVLGQTVSGYDYVPVGPGAVYTLYQQMIAALPTTFNVADLNSKFALLTSDGQQDLIVRTNPVPVPGAALLLGSSLLGLVGLRRTRRSA